MLVLINCIEALTNSERDVDTAPVLKLDNCTAFTSKDPVEIVFTLSAVARIILFAFKVPASNEFVERLDIA